VPHDNVECVDQITSFPVSDVSVSCQRVCAVQRVILGARVIRRAGEV
jgi:hypothetical protein